LVIRVYLKAPETRVTGSNKLKGQIMQRIIITYGAISGFIVITNMIIGFIVSGQQGFLASETFGYLVMLVALSMIFFGIKRHRDIELGGVIKFLPAFLMGLGIAAIAGIMYVTVWEIYLEVTDHAFIENYIEGVLKAKREAGVTGADYDLVVESMNQVRESYGNILYRLPVTFLEIFPIGAVVSIVSAAVLRFPSILPAKA
jgi:hypothetical protein